MPETLWLAIMAMKLMNRGEALVALTQRQDGIAAVALTHAQRRSRLVSAVALKVKLLRVQALETADFRCAPVPCAGKIAT